MFDRAAALLPPAPPRQAQPDHGRSGGLWPRFLLQEVSEPIEFARRRKIGVPQIVIVRHGSGSLSETGRVVTIPTRVARFGHLNVILRRLGTGDG
jgi:hypothetical protein